MSFYKTYEEARQNHKPMKRSAFPKPDREQAQARITLATGKRQGIRVRRKSKRQTVDGDSGKEIKNEMDQLVRDILALRDSECFTCHIRRDQWPLEVGHLIHRVNERVRWNLQNCNAQCRECNSEHNNDAEIYIGCFVQRYDVEAYAELRALSQRSHKPGYTQLLVLRDNLRSELEKLKGYEMKISGRIADGKI